MVKGDKVRATRRVYNHDGVVVAKRGEVGTVLGLRGSFVYVQFEYGVGGESPTALEQVRVK